MQKLLRRFLPWQIRWKGVLLESGLFLAAYTLWLIFRPPESTSRLFIGSLSILAPAVTAGILIFWFLPQIPESSRRAWRLFGLGMICWSIGSFLRTIFEGIQGALSTAFSAADIFNFLAYPLFLAALFSLPLENRNTPGRIRFLLDAIVSSGAAATLGWLMLGHSSTPLSILSLAPLAYPLADLILLMILINMLLAYRNVRRTLLFWGAGWFAFLLSDYVYSLLIPVNGYQTGGPESLGWTIGSLLLAIGAAVAADSLPEEPSPPDSDLDLGMRIQNVFPITFVLVLCWLVLVDWRLTGRLSLVGVWMTLLMSVVLVVRLGMRAGEVELNKYWQLFSSLAEPAFICDGQGRFLLENPALLRILHLEAGEVTGAPLTSIFEDQTIPIDMLARASKGEYSLEVLLRPDRIPYMLSLSPIHTEGRKVLIAGAAHDLSDQKRQQHEIQKAYNELQSVYKKLEELNAQLEQKVQDRTRTLSEAYEKLEEQNKILFGLDKLKSDFVSMVSHELRTPLTSLNGGLELLLTHKSHSAGDKKTLKLMKNEVQRLTRFVENILNLSAIEAGRINVSPKPLSLADIMDRVIHQFSVIVGGETIRVNLPDGLPKVMADEALIQSIFNHLIDNALKYAPGGWIKVEAFCVKNKVRISITDQGPGIPEEKRALLFQRFQRLDARDSQSVYGYGLGLYLSQKMLKAMRSELVFDAPKEGGARFYFDLKVSR